MYRIYIIKMDSNDDEIDYYGNKMSLNCMYCGKEFKRQGEMLFHERTWCVYEYKRKEEKSKNKKLKY